MLFARYGDRDVLYLGVIPMPIPAEGEVLVQARAVAPRAGETIALDRVRDAYAQLEQRHTHGKIVLIP